MRRPAVTVTDPPVTQELSVTPVQIVDTRDARRVC